MVLGYFRLKINCLEKITYLFLILAHIIIGSMAITLSDASGSCL